MVEKVKGRTAHESGTVLARDDRILRWPEVKQKVGLSRSHAHNLANQIDVDGNPRFPRPIKLGARASGWLESDINDWLARRMAGSAADGSHVA